MYYSKRTHKLIDYERSHRKGKMYNAILKRVKDGKTVRVPFGSADYQNFKDGTGLNLYPHLVHGDAKRRRLYRSRHKKDIKKGYYSPGWFSYYVLW